MIYMYLDFSYLLMQFKLLLSLIQLSIIIIKRLQYPSMQVMQSPLKFYKAKLHFYSSKLQPTKPLSQNSIYRFCSINSDIDETPQLRTKTQKSPQSDAKFSDSKVRLSVWNVPAKNVSPKCPLLQKSKEKLSSLEEKNNKPTLSYMGKMIERRKHQRQQYLLKMTSKNVDEIQVNKIQPPVNISGNAFLKIDKSSIIKNTTKPRFSFYSSFNKQHKPFSRSLAQLQNFGIDKSELQQEDPLSYTLNISERIGRNIRSFSNNKNTTKTPDCKTLDEELQAWTHRSRNDSIVIDFVSVKKAAHRPKSKLLRRKVNKLQINKLLVQGAEV